jgi:FAD/FMN-containing dehydrogenase/Fe-S oxidoreductase
MSKATSPDDRRELAVALGRAIRGDVRFDAYTRHLFSRDASMYAIEPIGVVFPRDGDDVAAVVATAAEFGVPVLPRGAGTSLAGQTVGDAVVMDLSRHLTQIIDIDAEARRARVQPGVVQEQLNLAAAGHGLMFGPDTSTANRATLGGMIGNNSAGSQSVRYGMTIDHVQALEVVLSDASRASFRPLPEADRAAQAARPTLEGAICRELPALAERHAEAIATGFPRFWRQSGGYRLDRLAARGSAAGSGGLDLATFVVGSEGTLATVVEATVKLVRRPRHRAIAVGHFTSTDDAIAATEDALACQPAAVELMDRTILDLSRQKIEYRVLGSILHGDPDALLFVTFFGDTEQEAAAGIDRLERRWREHRHGYHTLRAGAGEQQQALLKVRQASLGLLMAASTGTRRPLAFVEDTAVEPGKLPAYTRRFREILDSRGLTAGFYGHCSVGCLHIRPFVDLAAPGQREAMRAVAEEVRELVREYGGVNSSEHGDGLARSEFNRRVFGDALYAAMQECKRLFDPDGRMNPGKIVDAPAMTENLRDAAAVTAPAYASRLSFAAAGGMRGAADRCMNIGLCRKSATGVMCPSYMATREEEHSTRGRANALVKALSAADPRAALGDDRLHEILDLCLECKACKSECPLGVDMAALKSEALAARHELHGVPLRSRMFGSIRALNRAGSASYPLSNLAARARPARRMAERWLGVTAARPLPRFDRESLSRWFRRHAAPATPAPAGDVVFLADSFTTFTEPSVGRAAITLLRAGGWNVRLEDAGCCGRASLSKGLIDQARRMASGMVRRLADEAGRGVPIVAAEPSCLLTLRDEYPAVLPSDPLAAAVAAATRLPEELLVTAIAEGRLTLAGQSPVSGKRILFHGHCHQKALAGTAATLALLRSIPGAEVTEVDAGCCGMAGSFGFEQEHYRLSMRIGELRLFPAVRAEAPDTIIAASGVSCRQQIAHGTGRRAWHPLELAHQALVRLPEAAEDQGGLQGGQDGVPALVLAAALGAAAVEGLGAGIAGEHPVADRGAGVERHPGQAVGHRLAHVVEVRGPAADDRAEARHRVVPPGQLGRHHGQLHRAGHAHDERLGDPAGPGCRHRPLEQAAGHLGVPAGGGDRER